jgi:hypothetical protein
MVNDRASHPAGGREATADYLTTMLEELVPLAQRNGLPTVAYLLDMALMEAKTIANRSQEPVERSRRQE